MLVRVAMVVGSMLRSSNRLSERSWLGELCVRLARSLLVEAEKHPLDWLRGQLDNLNVFHPAMSKLVLEVRNVSGVACVFASPKGADSKTIVVYLHGGAYICGSVTNYRAMITKLAVDTGCLVVAPDYRLAPEYRFPAPQDDCLDVSKAIIEDYPDHKIVLIGDSAGGALAINTALELASEVSFEKHEFCRVKPVDALVLLSPWVEPTAVGGSMDDNEGNDFLTPSFIAQGYTALMQGEDAFNSRVNFVDVDLSALPKTLVQAGEGEMFVSQIQDFCQRATTAGADLTLQNYPGQFHVFQLFSVLLSDAKHAMQEIADFVKSV